MANNVKIRGLVYDITHISLFFDQRFDNFEPRSFVIPQWNIKKDETGELVGTFSVTLSCEELQYILSYYEDTSDILNANNEFTLSLTKDRYDTGTSFKFKFERCHIVDYSMSVVRGAEVRGKLVIEFKNVVHEHDA